MKYMTIDEFCDQRGICERTFYRRPHIILEYQNIIDKQRENDPIYQQNLKEYKQAVRNTAINNARHIVEQCLQELRSCSD